MSRGERGERIAAAVDSMRPRGNDRRMRFPWLPEEYERTCAECGHTWQVPRWARRRQVKSLRMMSRLMVTSDIGESTDSSDLSRQVESISAQNEAIDAFRHCPECGAEHFTQHASRGSQPR